MIIIDDNYCIGVDQYNYTLFRRKVKKSGKDEGQEYNEVVGYYSDIIQALESYLREIVRHNLLDGSMTLNDALKDILESNKYVAETISKAIPEVHIVYS